VIKIADGKDGCKTKFHTSYHINCNVFFVLIKSLKTKKKKKKKIFKKKKCEATQETGQLSI
jgi:hypothetical protein